MMTPAEAEEDEVTCWPGRVLASAMFGVILAYPALLTAPESLVIPLLLSAGIAFGSSASEVPHPGLLDRRKLCQVGYLTQI